MVMVRVWNCDFRLFCFGFGDEIDENEIIEG